MSDSFRTAHRTFSPPWLLEDERYLYITGLLMDGIQDALQHGIQGRFPGLGPAGSLAYTGRDRGIRRGFEEGDTSYAARQRGWIAAWKRAGSPVAVMGQLRGYLTGNDVPMRVVSKTGAGQIGWYYTDEDGVLSFSRTTGDWDWDGATDKNHRFWVILYPPSDLWEQGPMLGDGDLWGGALGLDGYTIGSTATPEQVATVQTIVREWKAAGSRAIRIIIAFDDTQFDPADAANPDGDWDHSPNRNVNAAYWPG